MRVCSLGISCYYPQETRVIITFQVTIEDGELTKSEEYSEIGFYRAVPGKTILIILSRSQKRATRIDYEKHLND